jgi:uncharacterized coiled-coil protein SlyX
MVDNASSEKEVLMSEPMAEPSSSGPSFLTKALRLLVGLTLAALLGIGLGVLGYVGLPWLYRGFSDPVLINATRVAQQEAELQDLQATLDQAEAQGQGRLAELEGQAAAQTATLAEQQVQLDALASELELLQQQVGDLGGSRDRLAKQEAAIGELAGQVEALQTLIAEGGGPLDRLEWRMALTQASLHVMRARLWLIENNAGLAAEEVEAARSLLAQAAEASPAEEAVPLQDVVERLRLTLEDLQLRPLVAADDLEIAWKLLTQLLASR